MVQHEVVQDDDPGVAPERVDDPAVRVRVVSDVVEGEIGAARRLLAPAAHDREVDPLPQRRHEEGAVVGDAALLGRHRREVGDPHASSLAIARSQVTSAASALPARPSAAASER